MGERERYHCAATARTETKRERETKRDVMEWTVSGKECVHAVCRMARTSHACTLQEHTCGWNCQIDHVIGNMFRCVSTGSVHICDQNCNQKIDYGPNEQICYVSRKVFQKEERAECRKRGPGDSFANHESYNKLQCM